MRTGREFKPITTFCFLYADNCYVMKSILSFVHDLFTTSCTEKNVFQYFNLKEMLEMRNACIF